jgi:CRISPR-associated endonuclease Csn1
MVRRPPCTSKWRAISPARWTNATRSRKHRTNTASATKRTRPTFAAEYGIAAKSREFEKFQLYREQQGKCAYSLKPLDLHRVLHDIGYAEVDHALPYSRSYDDGKNNKVLVLTEKTATRATAPPTNT